MMEWQNVAAVDWCSSAGNVAFMAWLKLSFEIKLKHSIIVVEEKSLLQKPIPCPMNMGFQLMAW